MKLQMIPALLLVLALSLVTGLLGFFSLAILADLVRMFLRGGYMLGGKEVVYAPLCPILTWLFAKWTREAWRALRSPG